MSDLAATNCGGCGCNEGGCNSYSLSDHHFIELLLW